MSSRECHFSVLLCCVVLYINHKNFSVFKSQASYLNYIRDGTVLKLLQKTNKVAKTPLPVRLEF